MAPPPSPPSIPLSSLVPNALRTRPRPLGGRAVGRRRRRYRKGRDKLRKTASREGKGGPTD